MTIRGIRYRPAKHRQVSHTAWRILPLLWRFSLGDMSTHFSVVPNNKVVTLGGVNFVANIIVQPVFTHKMWAGLAQRLGVRQISRRASARFRFGFSFSLKRKKERKKVVCGHYLLTLSLTINETLKSLSLLPILMHWGVILVVTV